MTTIRSLIALVAHRKWPMFQLDINNAFLHGDLFEEVYMKIPEGLQTSSPNNVRKLQKSLYGLKQSLRQWFAKLTMQLHHQGFVQLKSDYSLFIKRTPLSITIAAVYVDDIILTENSMPAIQSLKSHLNNHIQHQGLG